MVATFESKRARVADDGFERRAADKDDVVKLFDTPQLSGILHFQTLFFIIVRADITQRRM